MAGLGFPTYIRHARYPIKMPRSWMQQNVGLDTMMDFRRRYIKIRINMNKQQNMPVPQMAAIAIPWPSFSMRLSAIDM